MTSHGFGKPTVKSGTIDLKEIAEIAKQISDMKPIVRAHIVKRVVCGEEVGYDIIFEYGHLAKHDMTPGQLVRAVNAKLRVGDHKIANSSEFWVIQQTYQRGELLKQYDIPGE